MDTLRTLDRALDILECFTQESHRKLGVSDISRHVQLPKATAHRILQSLVQRGYLSWDDESKTYRLGYRALLLSTAYLDDQEYRFIALPYLRRLRDLTAQSVSLYIEQDGMRLCVERAPSREPLQQVVSVGTLLPLKGASGKILLAFQHRPESDELMPAGEAEQIRHQGYAISHGERVYGVSSVAAPIRNMTGTVIAAMALAGPSFRYTEEALPSFIRLITEHAQDISQELGYMTE